MNEFVIKEANFLDYSKKINYQGKTYTVFSPRNYSYNQATLLCNPHAVRPHHVRLIPIDVIRLWLDASISACFPLLKTLVEVCF
jgi:hypothetical protein